MSRPGTPYDNACAETFFKTRKAMSIPLLTQSVYHVAPYINGTLTRELLRYVELEDFEDADRKFEQNRQFYNNEQPHHALNLDTPAQHYTRSSREYSDVVSEWEYPENCELRKVKSSGYFNWNNQGYFLSEAFAGKEIAVRVSKHPGCVSLFFRQFRIGRIDVEKRVYTFKRAYLIRDDPRWTDT